ncbi:MAG TPA: polysaccharide deacetylase family protein, partial [Vicinamibacterales bacterium]
MTERARAALAVLLLLAGGVVVPAGLALAQDVIVRGPSEHRTIALTFDDGTDPGRCLRIGRILDEAGIPATWFPNGFRVRTAPNVWRSLARRFPMANHTLNHPSLVGRSRARIRAEVLRNERLIERITGRRMLHLLRPPFGAYDRRVVREAGRLGYRVVLWSLSSADTAPHSSDRAIAVRALSGGPGTILLMHCGPEVTPRILPIVIARYACAGYRFATLDGLLAGRRGVAAKVSCPAG